MPAAAKKEEFKAAEAFALMWYACECGHRERIWNSRSGVTPFGMGCPSCGNVMHHADFHLDTPAPNYKPHFGQRIFVNLTMERARELAERRYDAVRKSGYKDSMGRAARIEAVAKHEYEAFGAGTSPDVAVVGTQSVPVTEKVTA